MNAKIVLEAAQGQPVHSTTIEVATLKDASVKDTVTETPQFPVIVWWKDEGYLADRTVDGVQHYVRQTSFDL